MEQPVNCLREVGKGPVRRPEADRGQLRGVQWVRDEDRQSMYQLTVITSLKTFYVLRDVHLTPSTQNHPRRWVLFDTVLNTQYSESSKKMGAV